MADGPGGGIAVRASRMPEHVVRTRGSVGRRERLPQGVAGRVLGGEHRLVRVGVISMYVAVIFTLAAAVVVFALRGEPRLAFATELASQITKEQPTRPAKPLPDPEPTKAAPTKALPTPEAKPVPREPSKPVSEPEANQPPAPKPEAKPVPGKEKKPAAKSEPAKAVPTKAVAEPEPKPKPEPGLRPRPEPPPDPEPAPQAAKQPKREPADRPEQGPSPASRPEGRVGAAEKRPEAGEASRPDLPAGAVMTISASTLGLHDVPVANSASVRALDGGVVHLPDTSLPWDSGEGGRNVYLAGHRLGWPGTGSHRVFYRLDELRKGDWIVLKDARGRKYQYRVTGTSVVRPGDSWVKDPVPGRDMLTLQTCTPIPTFEKRLIVRANRV